MTDNKIKEQCPIFGGGYCSAYCTEECMEEYRDNPEFPSGDSCAHIRTDFDDAIDDMNNFFIHKENEL